jgi:FKBP-type peptidyl-prolyl cis-trans isomerase
MIRKFLTLLTVGCALISFSCSDDDDTFNHYAQWQKEVAAIDEYLAANNITAIKDARGVRMVIEELGTGLPATTLSTVDVDYVGTLFSTGGTFDSGNAKNILNRFIQGWQIALTTLPEGSKATLYIPSAYAYSNVASGSIPANSTLVFDIEFNSIVLTAAEIDRFKTDTTAIESYLAGKNITATTDTTGVRYVITDAGLGAPPEWYDPLKLSYSIKLLTNDTQNVASITAEPSDTFDSRTVDFLTGMMVGLQKIGPGGKITLYLPSRLAFGTAGASSNGALVVPPNTNIIVEIELQEIL